MKKEDQIQPSYVYLNPEVP